MHLVPRPRLGSYKGMDFVPIPANIFFVTPLSLIYRVGVLAYTRQ